ncbi:MAG: alpha-glucan family phosphorylase [Acidobacteriota bacterium]|nr:alpha-glucan family phosphorylase [Acidobacteriota bacterium]
MLSKQDTFIKDRLPPRLARLEDVAYNFWWSWNRSARDLFKAVDRMLWFNTRHNPVVILREVSDERLKQLAADPAFLRRMDAVLLEMDRHLKESEHWFHANFPNHAGGPIAYFSAEFGLHRSLPIYSGGLGVLSGDHLKEVSDLGLPLIAVGFLYEQGYFRQHIQPSGWQESVYPKLSPEKVALRPQLCENGECRTINLDVGDRVVHLQVWKVDVGRVPLYLMDTDHDGNAPWDRELTARLYGGDQEMRIQQEILLGIGGVRILRALGLEPSVWHINEGHSAFMLLDRLREYIAAGKSLAAAKKLVAESTVFTTHTPVPAGHDVFPYHLVEKYFHRFREDLGLSHDAFMDLGRTNGEHVSGFNMTGLALRLSGRANAVSRLHGEVSRRMWHVLWPKKEEKDVPIGHVTNGVHVPSWVGESMHALFRKHIDPDWLDKQNNGTFWEHIEDIPDEALWNAHQDMKRKMLSTIRERARRQRIERTASPEQILASGIFLNPEALVVGFARRFATYKRSTLIFRDFDRLLQLVHDRDRPLQLVFAGKAHPADDPGKRLLQEIYGIAMSPRLGGRIAFVEDYDMQLARYMVQGVDVWLNTPRRPQEASGTSGMKAALNGVLNLSILDGWWAEGYNGRNGWSIDTGREWPNHEEQDAAEAAELYRVLSEEVVPLFYQRDLSGMPRGWVSMMKDAIRTAGARFSARRMVQEYARKYYFPSLPKSGSSRSGKPKT